MTLGWPAVLLGWPSALGGMIALALGALLRKPRLAAVGALLAAGFSVYVGLNPMPFRILGPLALLANAGSAVAVFRGRTRLALALLLPLLGIVVYLGGAVSRR